MMIMPLPTNNLEFENIPGLLFKKVDDAGNAVDDAIITISPGLKYGTSEITSNSYFIDIENIVENQVYTLSETQVPNNYIKADDIYFKKVETSNENSKVKYEIRYGSTENIVNSDSGYQVLDLYNNNVIKMVDNRILGVKLSLDKFYKVGNTEMDLEGSKFSLYANNGTLICSGLDGNGDVFENETFKTLNNVYVENGYLKPGVYYLTEDVVPTHPNNDTTGDTFENPGKIYFTVDSEFNVHSGKPNVQYLLKGKTNASWGNVKEYYFITPDGIELHGDNTEELPNIVKVEIIANDEMEQYWMSNTADGTTVGSNSYNKRNISVEYYPAIPLTMCKIYDSNNDLKFESVKITDANNNVYFYSDTGQTIEVSYNTTNDVLAEGSISNTKSENGQCNSTLKIENKPDDGSINIPVQKKWAGDAGFEKLRAESVEVKLYQSTEEISDYNNLTDDMVYKFIQGEGEQATETEAKVTLNDANKWSHVFENLPSYYTKAGSEKKYPYYYYIKETKPPTSYKDSYSTSGDGTMIVTNTLQVVNINAQKIWSCNDDYKNMIPESIVLKIQWWNTNDEEDEGWQDISNKTITVKQSDNFKGVFKNLPAGYKYRIVEAYSPNGWIVGTKSEEKIVNDNDTTFTITNVPKLGSFTIQKDWSNDSADTRPQNIYLQLRRAVRKLWPKGQPFESVTNENGDIIEVGVSDDYARLLQYSLYFYDGNMCGDQVDENTAYTWRKDCHTTRDGEYAGGFHDAGDHVMFGLPAGYTASMLGWSMYEFPESFEELNQTAHMKIIEDYYCDFFMKCAKFDDDGNITAILYQKGNGTPDHEYWGMPEKQDEVMETEAGTELYWTDDAELNGAEVGGDVAAEYAAALTIAYLNYQQTYKYYDDDAQKYDNYLAMAEKLFDFALANRNCVNGQNIEYVDGKETGGYYKSTSIDDDKKWAAVWLDIATHKQKYSDYLNGKNPEYKGLNISWNDVDSAAAIAYALHVDPSKQQGIIDSINSSITNEVNDAQGNVRRTAKTEYMFGNDSGGWGQMRHNAAYQTSVLIANKFNNTDTKAEWAKWCQNQMDVILGNNASSGNDSRHLRTSTCYVTNFAENTLLHPHYRATSGMEVKMEAKNDPAVINGYDIDPYKLIGGLAGGWKNNGQNGFKDERLNYEETEVATDYNAGLVCAAAGLYDFYGTGHTYEIPGVKTQYLQLDPAIEAPEMMYVGDSINLNITGFDDVPSINWEIVTEEGEEAKAEFANDGTLTANETGLVKVKVSGDTVTGVTRSATAEIMVYDQPSISVPDDTVEENGTYIMEAGAEIQLTAENFEQDAEIEWSVTDTNGNSTDATSIDTSGKLTANDAGTVIVEAESQYKRATIMVKVNAPAVDAQADSAPISNSSDQISVNTSDTDAVMSRLMSYAIRQTSVRVLDDNIEYFTHSETYDFSSWLNGVSIPQKLEGMIISSIQITANGQSDMRLSGVVTLKNGDTNVKESVGYGTNTTITGINSPLTEIAVTKYDSYNVNNVILLFTYYEPPLTIKCEDYYVKPNAEISVDITHYEGEINWTLPNGFSSVGSDNKNFIVSSEPGEYTIIGTDSVSGETAEFKVKVIEEGDEIYPLEVNLTDSWQSVEKELSSDVKSGTIQEIGLTFNKVGTTSEKKFFISLNGGDETTLYFTDIDESLMYRILNVTSPLEKIKVRYDENSDKVTLQKISIVYTPYVPPLDYTIDSYFIKRNKSFNVEISNLNGSIEWTLPEGFSVAENGNKFVFTASDIPDTYTIRGTDSSGRNCEFNIEVLRPGYEVKKYSTQFVDADKTIPDEIKDYKIKKVAFQFDNLGTNASEHFYLWFNGNAVKNPTDENDSKIYFTQMMPAFNMIVFDNTYASLEKYKINSWNNSENIKLENVYFVYSTSGTFTVTPDSSSIVLGENTKLTIEGYAGDLSQIEWESNDVKWNSDGNYWYYCGNNLGSNISIIGTDYNGNEGVFTINVEEFSMITDNELSIADGSSYTLKCNAPANWNCDNEAASIVPSEDGKSCIVTINEYIDETITITATYANTPINTIITVLHCPLEVFLESTEIRAGSESEITVTAKGEEINGVDFTISPEGTGITIENNVIKVPADYSGESEVTITASKDGYASGESKLKIKPGLVVSPNGNIVMNVGDIKKFSAYNAIGNVTWENLTPEILSVTEKGYVTAKMFGTGKIQVSDDGTGDPIVIEINVQRVGVTVKLPENSEEVENFTLTSENLVNGSWQKTINNLPYINEYGDEYYYYIVETDEKWNPVTSVQGDGVSYIPISYTNNGLTLNDVNDKTLSVRNAATEKPQGLLPSTGGSGVKTYYYIGGAIMLLGIAGFTGIKRRERKRRKE